MKPCGTGVARAAAPVTYYAWKLGRRSLLRDRNSMTTPAMGKPTVHAAMASMLSAANAVYLSVSTGTERSEARYLHAAEQ